ncbi:hypothetical protein SpiBuddy_2339 [Sphaerochaeta globosa str. Buddy]|uniref:Uncharacterized protein n=1 Tax=Sphaerochaeta globosa (strain ATCC BAA-1886 / DSM 22777 / Buddy) TaxID=158189 RepID=F0RSQ2_SPHGB|nr:hypothetical protein SpiBuddy_2339 [Sphaerochaeta globosa str. Buddy]
MYMKKTSLLNSKNIHSQTSTIENPHDPTSAEIADFYLTREFGEVDADTRYPVRNLLSAILRILVSKHCNQQQDTRSFNSLLFSVLQNA